MTEDPHTAVVLISGGLDSTVLLHHVIRSLRRSPVHALSFHYGQRHVKELECARWQASAAGAAAHRVIDISCIGEWLKEATTLLSGGAPVPDLKDLNESQLAQPPTYVPNRNMMLLSMAAAYAEAQGIRDVFYGAQAQDEYGYWDCTAAFLERINHVLALNRNRRVAVQAPFVDMKKAETLRLGVSLGVDFARTWSCYRGSEIACGTCPTCIEREEAFILNGSVDPLIKT